MLKTLKILSELDSNYRRLLFAFELKYISFIGFKPQLTRCVSCSGETGDDVRFDIQEGGVVCRKCFTMNFSQISVKSDIIDLMKRLLYSKLEDLDSIIISKSEEKKIEEVLLRYITSHIEKKHFKSLEFLKTLN